MLTSLCKIRKSADLVGFRVQVECNIIRSYNCCILGVRERQMNINSCNHNSHFFCCKWNKNVFFHTYYWISVGVCELTVDYFEKHIFASRFFWLCVSLLRTALRARANKQFIISVLCVKAYEPHGGLHLHSQLTVQSVSRCARALEHHFTGQASKRKNTSLAPK